MMQALIAPAVLAMVKGGKQHRRWGKIYFWMMACVAATALVLGFYRPILFLALLAIFSFYLAFSGYRQIWWFLLVGQDFILQGRLHRPLLKFR